MNLENPCRELSSTVVVLLSILVLYGVGLTGCCGAYVPPPPPCPIASLFVDEALIPEPLVSLGSGDPPARYGVEFEEIEFVHPQEYEGGKVRQVIYRAENEWRAMRGYKDFVDTYFYAGPSFHCDDEETVWDIPAAIDFESSAADEWQLGCTIECTTDPQCCQYIGRYGVYFVWYYAWMSEVVTYTEFEDILEDIDSRMTQCLEQIENEATATGTALVP